MDSTTAHKPSAGTGHWPNRRRTRRFAALGALAAGLLAFSWLVWPTPYLYGRDGRDPDRHRISRLTGKAEVYDARKDEWRPAKRGRGNAEGMGSARSGSGGGSPIGGSRSGGGGSGDGDRWWYEDKAPAEKRARGDQWWYRDEKAGDEKEASRGQEGSPIGGSRESARKGSPIGGQ